METEERLREALEAIAQGRWGVLLQERYAGVYTGLARVVSVPDDAELRVLARAALRAEEA